MANDLMGLFFRLDALDRKMATLRGTVEALSIRLENATAAIQALMDLINDMESERRPTDDEYEFRPEGDGMTAPRTINIYQAIR